jgi:hypothetical protein
MVLGALGAGQAIRLVICFWSLVLAVGTSVPSTLNLHQNLVLASHKPLVVDEFCLKLTKVW